ncbi:097f0fb1-c4d8-42d4-bd80-ae142a3ed376 [Sclerotinia trifoliorum]|uniref:097f0fb1-c4d8-42d4-bd80-ae142a3ed376 n=1 Tax=Sclerotinia trifoliorum TaxID=28548 RepID=A0A8H2VQ41_9HELO|nr:097f0fb1-c4d8-42d4-bd80-ae142a3ed376 [Sclerotinia trifoliorum]
METPVLIELGRSYLQYPIYSDDENFALSFGRILKLRQDVRILATMVLQNLLSTYNISRDISHPILPDAFFGGHLRTEIDAMKAWAGKDWIDQSYEVQSKHYLHKIASINLTLIYVASGNKTEIARFSRDAAAYNLTEKSMLLDAKDREYLNTLAWDQQALVDFLVMTKSSIFVGIGHSNFAWNVALKRHAYSEMKEGYLDGPEILNDELSKVYGVMGMHPEYAACLWP